MISANPHYAILRSVRKVKDIAPVRPRSLCRDDAGRFSWHATAGSTRFPIVRRGVIPNRFLYLHGDRTRRGAGVAGSLRRFAVVRRDGHIFRVSLGGLPACSQERTSRAWSNKKRTPNLSVEGQRAAAALGEIYKVPHRRPSLRVMALAVGGWRHNAPCNRRRDGVLRDIRSALRAGLQLFMQAIAAIGDGSATGFARAVRLARSPQIHQTGPSVVR